MDSSQREFLLILAYLYLRYGKYDEALILYRVLYEYFPDDPEVILGLSFSLYITNRSSEAEQNLESLEGLVMQPTFQKLYYLIRSHVEWSLGRDDEARNTLVSYLGIEESEIRAQEANSGKEVEEYLL